ncbi:MAG: tRNA 4-thiouridine(8) synthase ThiI [Thermoplasmata archaeon]|nr:tRNA 4-thiouridine(8) synthase ThiI [Thermoplasmata archaeon]
MILIHYGEIGIKGKNRVVFENCLIRNISKALGNYAKKISKEYGRIIVFEENGKEEIKKRLEKIPGIENFSFVHETKLDIEEIKRKALEIAKGKKFTTFKISTKRANKDFPYSSMQVNEIVGEEIRKKLNKKVDLENAELTIFIEIGNKNAYIYTEKYEGVGGLPVGTEGKVISLLSGGIDSPVASWLMMKRGCKVIFAHFYNEKLVAKPSKAEEIVKKLNECQLESIAYYIPFADLQYEIIKEVPAKYRMIVYRRFMAKIANELARIEKAKAIVTGDSLGQVASQTLENLLCIYDASSLPVLSPLIGFDKKEIVEMAKKIGTYEISIKPYEDCCTFMVAKHPATKAKLEEIKEMESRVKIDLEKIIERAERKEYKL